MKLTDHKYKGPGIPSGYLRTLYAIFSLMLCAMSGQAQTYVTSGVLNGEVTGPAEYYNNSVIALNPGFHANGTNGTVHVYISGCMLLATLPSADQNYVMTTVPRVVGYNPSATGYTTCDAMQTIQYLDGLGRPLQTVQVKGNQDATKDLVQPVAYDQFGRETQKYLPYTTASGNPGSYRADALTAGSGVAAFYNPTGTGTSGSQQANGIPVIPNPYSQMALEASPMNRPVEQGAPGTDWQLGSHTAKTAYTFNDQSTFSSTPATNNPGSRMVALYVATVNADGSRTLSRANSNAATYDSNQLTVTIAKDENWQSTDGCVGTVETYKDKMGNTVLKRTYNLNGSGQVEMLSTYYIYDNFNKLAFVLPPGATPDATSAVTQTTLDNLCYQYRYDARGRANKKKLPGKGWEFTIYNALDQPVATQDANQRNKANQDWTFVRYDNLGRSVMTGIYQYGATAGQDYSADVQTQANAFTTLWEGYTGTPTNYGYTSVSFPASSSSTLSVTYYDNYGFAGTNPYPYSGGTNMTRGLTTATLTNVLGTSDMLWAVHYYDDKGRNIKTFQQHYLGGNQSVYNYDELTTTYNDFTSEVTGTDRKHYTKNSGNTAAQLAVTIDNGYTYDHIGRKTQSTEQINGGTVVQLSNTEFNEVGQVLDKKLHSVNGSTPLQTVSYAYNERGWLTNLNSTLFQEYLQYNDVSLISNVGAVRQYNGNIASQSWGSTATGINHDTYVYLYDNLNRLTSGNCTNGFSENNISYDLMGNIKTLYRYQPGAVLIDNLSYGYTNGGNSTNRVQNIADASADNSIYGYKAGSYTYQYDANGNMQADNSKGLTIAYNLFNLPQSNTLPGKTITYFYDAAGRKLRRLLVSGTSTTTTDYIGGIQYANNVIDFIQTEEGRILNLSGTPNYEYNLKDHLGNNRVTFDSSSGTSAPKQQDDYYPFGLEISKVAGGGKNEYLYNDKELQEELGQYDYGARFYDPVIARWTSVDPMADVYQHWSPYNYGANNPITFTDPTGMSIEGSKTPGVATRYVDPSGNTILNTNDGRDDVFMVPWSKIKDFKNNIFWTNKADGDNGTDGIGWNNYWRGEFNEVISETTLKQAGYYGLSSEESQAASVKYLITGNPSDMVALVNAERRAQWSDPVVVISSLLAFAHATVGMIEAFDARKFYRARVRARGLEDPTSHNFPYSFDNAILSTKPTITETGYRIYTLEGSMNGKSGVFEIGVDQQGVIDHRFFRPNKK